MYCNCYEEFSQKSTRTKNEIRGTSDEHAGLSALTTRICLKKFKNDLVPLSHILFVSTALFFIGMYGLFTRRNMITMLMSVELILNSVNINFVAFNKYLYPNQLNGIFFAIFIITIAAAEAAVAIAIIINLYRSHHSIDVEDAGEMKW